MVDKKDEKKDCDKKEPIDGIEYANLIKETGNFLRTEAKKEGPDRKGRLERCGKG